MTENYNKRSLKKRITRMFSMLNFYALFVMLIAMVIALGITFKIFSEIVSVNAANQMSFQLRDQITNAINEDKIPKEYTELTPVYTDIFRKIGISYVFQLDNKSNINIGNSKNINITAPKNMPILTIDYSILKNNKLIYTSSSSNNVNNNKNGTIPDNWIMKLLNTTTSAEVTNDNNEALFNIVVKLNPVIIFFGYLFLIGICIIIFLITLFISKISARMLSSMIIRPLLDLDKKMKELANGNLEAAINTEIKFKKPIYEVENLANNTNVIMSRMHEYIDTLAKQNLELESQNLTLEENGSELESINRVLDNKNSKLKNIFNNVDQGFLTFKKNLLIQSEYSYECEKLFNGSISEKKLSLILYPINLNMNKFVEELLIKIFEGNKSQRKLYTPLLPDEMTVNGRIISLTYKVVKDEKKEDTMMVIITDISEKRLLEKQMHKEKNILKMVVKTIINRDEFRDLVKEYEHFSDNPFNDIPSDKYEEVFRQIHNFKGNFSQYEMVNIVSMLDDLESKLYEKSNDFNVSDVDNLKLKSWLRDDLEIIKSYAGTDFMKEGEYFYIRKEKLLQIESKIEETLSQNECKIILPLIKSLSYKSLKELLRTYPDYVVKLCERLGKTIMPLEISGDDVMVDTNNYQDVIKSFVHIFRNCVDHGIESEDERLEIGKDQIGRITCEIKDLKDDFKVIISDDGRGIDVETLEKRVLTEGLYTIDELSKMDKNEKLHFIFKQGITTKEKATFVSGRGVGMSAVKQCINDHNGNIEIESEKNKGTKFIITLPKIENDEKSIFTSLEFMEEITKAARDFIKTQTAVNLKIRDIEVKNMISLNKVTSLISLKGPFNSILMISINEVIAKKLVHGFILDDINKDDEINYIEDVLGEITNIILGTTFGKFENSNIQFHLGIPAMLSNSDAYIKYTQSEILSSRLDNDEYEFSIYMLLAEDETSVINLGEEI